eukprot:scaffold6156_cov83-Cylindrotheca_fusiformis.AAC.2
MADNEPPPNPDGMHPSGVDSAVSDLSDAVKDLGSGAAWNESDGRKIHSFKTSLYLSIDSPGTAAGSKFVRNKIAMWLSKVKNCNATKGLAIAITTLDRKRLDVASLPTDGQECQDLVGWTIRTTEGSYKNVFLCVTITALVKFSTIKHSIIDFLKQSQIQMNRNHSLGDTAIEMASIGTVSPILPDLFLCQIEDTLNRHLMKNARTKGDAAELKMFKIDVKAPGEISLTHSAVSGTSSKFGKITNKRGVVVGGKDLVGKSQPELTILAPTRKEKNKRVTNERNVMWAKILGNSQEQGTRDVMRHRVDQQVGRI